MHINKSSSRREKCVVTFPAMSWYFLCEIVHRTESLEPAPWRYRDDLRVTVMEIQLAPSPYPCEHENLGTLSPRPPGLCHSGPRDRIRLIACFIITLLRLKIHPLHNSPTESIQFSGFYCTHSCLTIPGDCSSDLCLYGFTLSRYSCIDRPTHPICCLCLASCLE